MNEMSGGWQTGRDQSAAENKTVLSPAEQMLWIMVNDLLDPIDRPEMWAAMPQFLEQLPGLPEAAAEAREIVACGPDDLKTAVEIVNGLCEAYTGRLDSALARLTHLGNIQNQLPVAQGALFHVQGLADPGNPKYKLEGKYCRAPFEALHVLEDTTHLCCASWLPQSSGNLNGVDWGEVWNSDMSQAIRASIHDGSFRHCNKTACPRIQDDRLIAAEALAAESPHWHQIVEEKETELAHGPQDVNLAYDKTCNLSCPSCRVAKLAADSETRSRYDRLQERAILPMLKQAKMVFITGSGDPFASKNFRHLMERLTADDYPDLKFRIMTNAMLFTPREWERFPALHGRVFSLQISIDGASKDTHELLRRGARWDVMQENLRFAAGLRKQGLIDDMMLSFTVQVENFHEMGLAAQLADELEIDTIYYGRLTNWGTCTPEQYERKAVFSPGHERHQEFLAAMADPRLLSKRVMLGNLREFLPLTAQAA